MTNQQFVDFVERLLSRLRDHDGNKSITYDSLANIIEILQYELNAIEEQEQEIENQALNDAHYQDRYGKD